jgi:hypothetical protein
VAVVDVDVAAVDVNANAELFACSPRPARHELVRVLEDFGLCGLVVFELALQ